MIKHHFFQRFEDFRDESDRSAIVFVRRFILVWIEVTLLIAQSIWSTVSDQPLLFWLLLIVIFQTNMILKGEIANLQILLKLKYSWTITVLCGGGASKPLLQALFKHYWLSEIIGTRQN